MALPDIDVHRAASEPPDEVSAHRWTREEYERIAEMGGFPSDRRVELIDGILYDMSPQSGRHAKGIVLANQVLMAAFGPGYHIRPQLPLSLGDDSMPEPDIAVISGSPADYTDHPPGAVLVLEVAETSQLHDGERKPRVYARAGIRDYWIVDLRRDAILILREPQAEGYRQRLVFHQGERISPLAQPKISIAVEDLLPGKSAKG